MLKDKEFIGRVCRSAQTDSPIDFSVFKVIRSQENSILGFEISASQSRLDQPIIVNKDEVEFQLNNIWVQGSDFIIYLLEKKINDLRRQIKISTAQRKR
ncbi:hypothetical protein ACLILV_14360 [Acinetobacter johnsonii]|uniref:hypothetical protein n=1 Tax=Acinetobacter johnsonii TaxID=40214 RepID=UPI00398551AC